MKYYIITNDLFDDSEFAYGEQKEESYNTGKAKTCPDCGNVISMLEWLPPFEITLSKKKVGDFIYGSFVGFVISQGVKEKIEQSNLKGIDTFNKVDLYHRKKLLQEDYFYPEIPLINAFVDLRKIDLEDKKLCNTCQKGGSILNKINGIYFSEAEKITEDIFFTTSLGQSTIVVSENFKNLVDLNSFTNVDLIEASQYRWDSMNP